MSSRDIDQVSLSDWAKLARSELNLSATEAEPAEALRERLSWRTSEGIEVPALCTSRDLAQSAFEESLPGVLPFTRGPHATMYAGRPWTLRQYAGFSTAKESNAFYRDALAAGQRGLSVAFDLPTHRGYDSDHPRVAGDVGKAGVAIDSVEDMHTLFREIPLDAVSVSMTMNGAVLPVLAAFIVAAEESGVSPSALRGTIQNDILKEFLVRNTFIYPPEPSMRIVADIIAHCSAELPRFNTVSISGYHLQEAGATADLELGLTLANGLEYVRAASQVGLQVDAFAPRLSFFFGIGMNFFMEVAKLRAARLLWAELMQQHFAPKDAASCRLRTHCQTSGVSLTAQAPLNNVVRTTIEAMAAVMGGTQSLHTNSYDEALALPSDAAAAIARNTQLILQEEAGVTHAIDPFGGSYFMESLTSMLAGRARLVVEEALAAGGMTRAISQGWPQQRIAAAAAAYQARVDRGEQRIVGVNCYLGEPEGPGPDVRRIDNERVLREQLEKLAALKARRDAAEVASCLQALRTAAETMGKGNLLALSVAALRARATVGEVSSALEQVFGRYQPSTEGVRGVYQQSYCDDPEWQAVVDQVVAFERSTGRRPRLLIVKLGQDGHDRGAKVMASALADLGFDVELGPLFQTPEEAAKQAIDSDAHVVGVSTLAGAHTALVPELIAALHAGEGSDIRVVCGGIIPDADAQSLQQAGVAAIFGPGTPVLEAAKKILRALEEA